MASIIASMGNKWWNKVCETELQKLQKIIHVKFCFKKDKQHNVTDVGYSKFKTCKETTPQKHDLHQEQTRRERGLQHGDDKRSRSTVTSWTSDRALWYNFECNIKIPFSRSKFVCGRTVCKFTDSCLATLAQAFNNSIWDHVIGWFTDTHRCQSSGALSSVARFSRC